jgi:Recombination endonuclease VII
MTAACSACGGTPSSLLVRDHCHRHGQPRGEICRRCNGLVAFIDRGELPGKSPGPKPITLLEILKLNEYRDRCSDCAQAA